MPKLILIAHNIRSTHNVGSLLRTADGIGVDKVYLSGYTPYPEAPADKRLTHLVRKLTAQIHKTALGAEVSQPWEHCDDISQLISDLKRRGFVVGALEQAPGSLPLPAFHAPNKLALIVGRETEGLESDILQQTDIILEIPMAGRKESFNVVQAAAMALYHCRFRL